MSLNVIKSPFMQEEAGYPRYAGGGGLPTGWGWGSVTHGMRLRVGYPRYVPGGGLPTLCTGRRVTHGWCWGRVTHGWCWGSGYPRAVQWRVTHVQYSGGLPTVVYAGLPTVVYAGYPRWDESRETAGWGAGGTAGMRSRAGWYTIRVGIGTAQSSRGCPYCTALGVPRRTAAVPACWCTPLHRLAAVWRCPGLYFSCLSWVAVPGPSFSFQSCLVLSVRISSGSRLVLGQ